MAMYFQMFELAEWLDETSIQLLSYQVSLVLTSLYTSSHLCHRFVATLFRTPWYLCILYQQDTTILPATSPTRPKPTYSGTGIVTLLCHLYGPRNGHHARFYDRWAQSNFAIPAESHQVRGQQVDAHLGQPHELKSGAVYLQGYGHL